MNTLVGNVLVVCSDNGRAMTLARELLNQVCYRFDFQSEEIRSKWLPGEDRWVELLSKQAPEEFGLAIVHESDESDFPAPFRRRCRLLLYFSASGFPKSTESNEDARRKFLDLDASTTIEPIEFRLVPAFDATHCPITEADVDALRALLAGTSVPLPNILVDGQPQQTGPEPSPDRPKDAATEAVLELLAAERLLGKGLAPEQLTTDAIQEVVQDRHAPLMLPQKAQILSGVWHSWKNLLSRIARQPDPPAQGSIVWDLFSQLRVVEEVYFGGSHSSISTIERLMEVGRWEEAAATSLQTYNDLSGIAPGERRSSCHFDILLVDDSPEYLGHAQATFERLALACKRYAIGVRSVNPKAAYADCLRNLSRHPTIQAVVVDWDLESGKQGDPGSNETGGDLIKLIDKRHPGKYICVLTGRAVCGVTTQEPDLYGRVFAKHDPTALEEIFADILEQIKKRAETPFFSALRSYAERPMTVFHALALSRGKTVRKSTWLGDFYDFYGDHVFMAESSATQAPLDSLFQPTGSIAAAQNAAARVFGAQRSFFVTNGTSTANKIVHQAVLSPGDVVLIDRNCHKSHHYGMVLLGTRPVYLQAAPLWYGEAFTGICQGVSISEIMRQLEANPTAKMLCLTNCTFDGYVHNTRAIIAAVWETLLKLGIKGKATRPEDFVFFFDEAWFGFARFTEELLPFTAMYAAMYPAGEYHEARVYATQSTHKTLTAFRQGSMIHVRDPQFEKTVSHRFNEAIFTHSTTSPSYNLIASLDAGRMQADLEGPSLCAESWDLAASIRQALPMEKDLNEYFQILTPEEMGAYIPVSGTTPDGIDRFALDQTKLTLFLKSASGIDGETLRRRLLDDFNIQFNKLTNNTALLMINAGSTESSVGHLIVALRGLAKQLRKRGKADGAQSVPTDAKADAIFKRPVQFFHDDNDIRRYFFGSPEGAGDSVMMSLDEADEALDKGHCLVSANFVIPYPPGFPVLVPGELVDKAAIRYLEGLAVKEVHGLPKAGWLQVWSLIQ